MLFALRDGKRVIPTKGESAICPCCGGRVLAKCGDINIWHWSHVSRVDCAAFYKNETPWHREWKSHFPNEWQEIVIKDKETGVKHIADVLLPNGTVIEFQNSPISAKTIAERESFYKKMIWVINGDKFREQIKYTSHPKFAIWKHRRKVWDKSVCPKFVDFPFRSFPPCPIEFPAWAYLKIRQEAEAQWQKESENLLWIKRIDTKYSRIEYSHIGFNKFLDKYS